MGQLIGFALTGMKSLTSQATALQAYRNFEQVVPDKAYDSDDVVE